MSDDDEARDARVDTGEEGSVEPSSSLGDEIGDLRVKEELSRVSCRQMRRQHQVQGSRYRERP